MAKMLACKDAGTNCDWVGKAETEEELLQQVVKHAKEGHGIDLPPGMLQQAKLIMKDVK